MSNTMKSEIERFPMERIDIPSYSYLSASAIFLDTEGEA